MRIPTFLLIHTAYITPYQGSGAYGKVYGEGYTAKCRVQPITKKTASGSPVSNEGVKVTAVALFPPDTVLEVGSKVTVDSVEYEVLMSKPHYVTSTIHHVEAELG